MENVYEKYHVSQVINASGKMTILGGSRVAQDVCQHIQLGAGQFFEMKDLLDKTGEYLAKLLQVEAAYIVNSASGGIAQSVAACVNQGQLRYILDIHNENNKKREIVLCKGHHIDYGAPISVAISMGGGKIVEAGYANRCTLDHIQAQICENTAALLYVKSHHCVQKSMPAVEDFIQLAHQNHLPAIIDAAAEGDLKKYSDMGADVVIYSGTKALEGPTSGLLIGKADFIQKVKLQSQGIGRVMKIGKENILGLTYAIEKYLTKKPISVENQIQRLEHFHQKINQIQGLSARWVQDEAGRPIIRSELTFTKISALEVAQKLKEGNLKIYTRDYHANEGKIEIDIRDVNDEELETIYQKIKMIMEGRLS